MRRKDREITDPAEIESILSEAAVCRIALADGGEPYVVPVSFGYADGAVYIHSAAEGKKIALIRKNPRCCFEVDIYGGIIRGENPCSWGMRYRSVIGSGRAEILSDPEEKKRGLTCIVRHYQGENPVFSEEAVKNVAVIRIAIDSMTGKKTEIAD